VAARFRVGNQARSKDAGFFQKPGICFSDEQLVFTEIALSSPRGLFIALSWNGICTIVPIRT
jgi:hypothetical protein